MSKLKTNLFIYTGVALLFLFTINVFSVQAASQKNVISLNESTHVLKKGKKVRLKATVSGKKYQSRKLIWTSSAKSVATVSKTGLVKAKKQGKTWISVRIAGTKYKARCKVIVGTPVKSIKLSTGSCTLHPGEKFVIQASVLPKKASVKKIVYQSDKPAVAAVDGNGVVTALAPGSTKITLTAADGSGKKAVFHVIVEKAAVQKEDEPEPATETSGESTAAVSEDTSSSVYRIGTPGLKAGQLLDWMEKFSAFIRQYGDRFYKSGTPTVNTYEQALAVIESGDEDDNKVQIGINCNSPINWALREMGLEPEGTIYGNEDGFVITKSSTQSLLSENATFISSGPAIGLSIQAASKRRLLQSGDVIASYIIRDGTVIPHSCVYAGVSAQGYALVYEAGNIPYTIGYSLCGCGPLDYHNYSNYYISEIMRLN